MQRHSDGQRVDILIMISGNCRRIWFCVILFPLLVLSKINRPTQDLPVEKIYSIDNSGPDSPNGAAFGRLMKKFEGKLVNKFASKYDLDPANLRIDDLFITKYDADIPQKNKLGPHR